MRGARSSKLLSGASVVAVIAALAAAGNASASQTVSGPLPSSAINNANTDWVRIDNNATVYADTNGDSFYNGLNMVPSGTASLLVDSSYLAGAIHNAGQMLGTFSSIAIQANSQVDGGIWNEGTINGASGYGIFIFSDSSIDNGLLNDGTIIGSTGGIMLGTNSDINGGLTNNGLIQGAIGFNMNGASSELRGGIVNNSGASIVGTTTAAISVSGLGAQLKGGITNDGSITGQNNANGIQLLNGTITGGITNNQGAVIQVTGVSATAILVNGATFNGDITNSGQILATNTSSYGIVLNGTTAFTGNIVNNSTGLISAHKTDISVGGTSFTGNVTNYGSLVSGTSAGISVSATTFTGNVTNAAGGVIDGWNGIEVVGGTFNGNIVNDGVINTSGFTGIWINAAAAVTGNITNNGEINSLVASGIYVGPTLTGAIANGANGTITAQVDGIQIAGNVTGGISNAGTIIGVTGAGIDVGAATAGQTITQTAGLIRGGNGVTVGTALNLVNTQADTFNGDGGTLDGDVNADAAGNDDFVMHASGTFSYLRGTATGLDQFDMQGSGTAVLGADLRGSTGVGVTVNAVSMTHNSGTVYLDDDTVVNLSGNYTQTAGTLEFQLTSDTTPGAYGVINVGGTANLGGNIAAYVQGNTFGSIGGNTFTYQDVILGTTAGTFANAATITTNSIFFTGQALVNAGDVDIVLTRQSFSNALTLPGLSQNQLTMGATLDTIYNAGGYSADFTDLFNYLLSIPAGSEAEVARVYDDLAGSEHASLQDVGLRVSQQFNDAIGARLDDLRGPVGGGSSMAAAALRRYADATPPAVMSDAIDRPSGMRGSTSLWGRGYGSWANSDGDAEAAGYDQDTGGFAGGVDFAVDSRWNVGGALGYSTTDVNFDTPRDSANVDSFQLAGYGSFKGSSFYADAEINVGFHDFSTTRLIEVTLNPPVVATANYDANTFGVRTEAGVIYDSGRIDFTPFLGLAYNSNSTDGFVESGAGSFSLLVADSDADSLTTTLGLRLSGAWQAGGVRLVPAAEVAWRHEFLDDNQSFTAAFLEDPSTQFQIISAEQTRDTIVANVGLGAQVSKGLVLFLDYNGLFSSSISSHGASAGLRASW